MHVSQCKCKCKYVCMHTHVCHCSNKCVRAFNVDQFIPYSSMFYSQLVISSSPYFLISDIFSVYMILTINHLQRLLFDTSLYLLTLLSNVAEAKPLYAAAMAHYDVLEGLDKCHLKILYHIIQFVIIQQVNATSAKCWF